MAGKSTDDTVNAEADSSLTVPVMFLSCNARAASRHRALCFSLQDLCSADIFQADRADRIKDRGF